MKGEWFLIGSRGRDFQLIQSEWLKYKRDFDTSHTMMTKYFLFPFSVYEISQMLFMLLQTHTLPITVAWASRKLSLESTEDISTSCSAESGKILLWLIILCGSRNKALIQLGSVFWVRPLKSRWDLIAFRKFVKTYYKTVVELTFISFYSSENKLLNHFKAETSAVGTFLSESIRCLNRIL